MDSSEKGAKRRFISITELLQRARITFERFPLVILAAIGAAIFATYLAHIDFDSELGADALVPVLIVCILGIPLFFWLRVLGERLNWTSRTQIVAGLTGVAALVGYYLILPAPVKGADVTTYLLLIAAAHLIASFAPYFGRPEEENAFWQYNKILFLRFALAALYSVVLFIGLTLAIAACETLLDIDFDDEIYAQLWFWVAFVYNTWFFLAGVPRDLRSLQEVRDYPTGLRIFTQYALIPLVVIYLLILYIYTGKILVEWNLPEGWVGYPVIGVAVTGVLALLLVHPIRQQAAHAWIVTYSKIFYWALYPLIVLIGIAIWTRIGEYGITEKRYLVAVATAWLLGITLYFTFKRAKDIRIIPISLCVVTLLSAVGPWSATATSRRSQLNRLRELLIAEEVMVGGVIDSTPKRVEFERRQEISNIVNYIYNLHGLDRISDWYARPEVLAESPRPNRAMEEMGLKYISPWMRPPEGFSVSATVPNPLSLDGFDYFYALSERFKPDTVRFRTVLAEQGDALATAVMELRLRGTVLDVGPPSGTDRLSVDLGPMLLNLKDKEEVGEAFGPDETSLAVENERYRLLLYLRDASGGGEGDSLALSHISASLLIDVK